MPSKNSGESLYNYCNRLINSDNIDDQQWGKQLLSEWDYTKNDNLGIDILKINKGSRIKAYWTCSNKHSFMCQIVQRTGVDKKHRSTCRICSYKHRANLTHIRAIDRCTFNEWCNDNYKIGSILLSEFDTEENYKHGITIDNISPFSETKIFWKCKFGHKFSAYLNNRTANFTGCPYCKGTGTSYSEQLLYFIFLELYPKSISRGKFLYHGKKVEFDIAIPELRMCIEYGTEYTHSTVESPLKTQLCNEKDIDLVYIHAITYDDEYWSKNKIVFKQSWINNSLDDMINIVRYILSVRGINSELLETIDYDNIVNKAYSISHGHINECDSLLVNNSLLCKEWNYKLNSCGPESYKKYSNKQVWWVCNNCGHEWKASIINRNYNKSGCPECGWNILDNKYKQVHKRI